MDSETYVQGGDVELYISAGLGLPLALFFLAFTVLNLFGEVMGTFGRKFIFEMDAVMGGLLGIPHYSKLEVIMLGFGMVGASLLWSRSPDLQFVAILGLIIVDLYLLICVAYGINARQPLAPFLVMIVPITLITIWRCVSFLNPVYHTKVSIVTIAGVILSVVSHFIMRSRKVELGPVIQKLIDIQQFEKDQKAANPEWKMEWLRGENEPQGFKEAMEIKQK